MRWFGHVERSVGWISQVRKLDLDTCKKPGRHKKAWNELMLNDKKRRFVRFHSIALNGKADFEIELLKSPTLGKEKRAIERI